MTLPSICAIMTMDYKYFLDLSGDDLEMKLSTTSFLRQVADVPTNVQEKFLKLCKWQQSYWNEHFTFL